MLEATIEVPCTCDAAPTGRDGEREREMTRAFSLAQEIEAILARQPATSGTRARVARGVAGSLVDALEALVTDRRGARAWNG